MASVNTPIEREGNAMVRGLERTLRSDAHAGADLEVLLLEKRCGRDPDHRAAVVTVHEERLLGHEAAAALHAAVRSLDEKAARRAFQTALRHEVHDAWVAPIALRFHSPILSGPVR